MVNDFCNIVDNANALSELSLLWRVIEEMISFLFWSGRMNDVTSDHCGHAGLRIYTIELMQNLVATLKSLWFTTASFISQPVPQGLGMSFSKLADQGNDSGGEAAKVK